ncbi:MAG: hypothetical protein J7604_03715 [Sporocytophaga sp.]|uniref:DUF6252 family protein n=1 Tax=Sporocytophaga sp. TaxID=2231183 RepID=UPI001B264AAC|nr:DUF6252 family protein [Sporocytophaga sp.]MBO9699289.1 hypothetical protein [Sporocytophaga sp.]
MKYPGSFLKFSLVVLLLNSCNYKEDGDLDFPGPLPPPPVKKQVEASVNGKKWEGAGRALYTKESVTLLCKSDNGDSLIIVVKANKPGVYQLKKGSKSYARFKSSGEYSTAPDLIGGSVEIIKIDTVSHSIDANFSFNATGSSGTVEVLEGRASSVIYLHYECYINGKYWSSKIDGYYPLIDIKSSNSVDGYNSSNMELYISDMKLDSLQIGKTLDVKTKGVSCFYVPPSGDYMEAIQGKLLVRDFYTFEEVEYLNATFEFDILSTNGTDTIKVRDGSMAVWKPIQ